MINIMHITLMLKAARSLRPGASRGISRLHAATHRVRCVTFSYAEASSPRGASVLLAIAVGNLSTQTAPGCVDLALRRALLERARLVRRAVP